MPEELDPMSKSPIVLYRTADGKVTVDVFFAKDNFWLTQKTMAELFGVKTPAISKHLRSIFDSGELAEGAVVSILETTAADGKNYQTQFYNLDAVIAVDYWSHRLVAKDANIAGAKRREYPGKAGRGSYWLN